MKREILKTDRKVIKHERLKTDRNVKITKAFVDGQPLRQSGQRYFYDRQLTGFGIVIGKTAKSYFAERQVKGECRRITIGRHGVFTPDQARRRANEILYQMALGKNPAEEEQKSRRRSDELPITLLRAFNDYKTTRSLKPRTVLDYEQIFRRTFTDWYHLPVNQLTRGMVIERHERMKKESGWPYADYGMRILSGVLNYATARHNGPDGKSLIPDNPVRVLSLLKLWDKLRQRTNIIEERDLPIWFSAIENLRHKQYPPSASVGCDYLELVLFTGLRRNEAATMQWGQISFDEDTLKIENTKNDEPHILPLTNYLHQLLLHRHDEAKQIGSPWVFPSAGTGKGRGHLAEPKCVADRVTETSGVNFTIHDLRRTFATVADGLDIPYYALKKLMNHTMSGDVTRGYQRSTVKRLREPMRKITEYFLSAKAKGLGMKITEAS